MGNKFQCALITGATAGIGQAIAERLASEGINLVITGRRKERLTALQNRLQEKFKVKVHTLSFDIQNREQTQSALNSLSVKADDVDVLVNNAGLALGTSKVQDADLTDWDVMIDTNVKGLLYLTRFFTPRFIKKGRGHIINLGSVAGRWVYTGGSVYCATKYAVRAISEGLRMDLLGTPVRVTNIEPGLVETEFSMVRLKDQEKAKTVYKGLTPLSAEDIAESVQWCLQRPPHVNIQELVIFPTDQAAVGMIHRR